MNNIHKEAEAGFDRTYRQFPLTLRKRQLVTELAHLRNREQAIKSELRIIDWKLAHPLY